MHLDALLGGIEVLSVVGDPTREITGITHDSRRVSPGALFCCVPGRLADGHDFAPLAVAAGAAALLCQRPLGTGATEVVVRDVRRAMGPVAAEFHGRPSAALTLVGVTGTNGKTTTVHLVHSVLAAAGWRSGVIGTLTGARTTPEAPELQALLATMRDQATAAVAVEVSSHALAMHRTAGTRFDVAVFTNLSRDHLDFHASMEDYFAAKASLFEPGVAERAVVNLDDAHGRLLHDAAQVPTVGYQLHDAAELVVGAAQSTFRWRGVPMRVPMGGRFNVSNALAAATVGASLGIDATTIAAGLEAAGPVPGRFESIDEGQPFRVLVDYAHTPDGLEEVLAAAREVAGGHRVIVVFGAGGDRDRAKRPAMGTVAARGADIAVVTSDNPRSEDPGAIISDIMGGVPDQSAPGADAAVLVDADRRAAIAAALAVARAGDVVVVAGKGHETTQTFGEHVVPFDDRAVVHELLREAEASW